MRTNGGLFNNKVWYLRIGTHSGVLMNRLTEVNARNRAQSSALHLTQIGFDRGHMVAILHLICVGTHNQVSMNRGGHQDSLEAVLVGTGEYHGVNDAPLAFVQNVILAAKICLFQPVAPHQLINLGGKGPPGVDNIAGFIASGTGYHHKVILIPLNPGYAG